MFWKLIRVVRKWEKMCLLISCSDTGRVDPDLIRRVLGFDFSCGMSNIEVLFRLICVLLVVKFQSRGCRVLVLSRSSYNTKGCSILYLVKYRALNLINSFVVWVNCRMKPQGVRFVLVPVSTNDSFSCVSKYLCTWAECIRLVGRTYTNGYWVNFMTNSNGP